MMNNFLRGKNDTGKYIMHKGKSSILALVPFNYVPGYNGAKTLLWEIQFFPVC